MCPDYFFQTSHVVSIFSQPQAHESTFSCASICLPTDLWTCLIGTVTCRQFPNLTFAPRKTCHSQAATSRFIAIMSQCIYYTKNPQPMQGVLGKYCTFLRASYESGSQRRFVTGGSSLPSWHINGSGYVATATSEESRQAFRAAAWLVEPLLPRLGSGELARQATCGRFWICGDSHERGKPTGFSRCCLTARPCNGELASIPTCR